MALTATLLACKGKNLETAESVDAQDRHDFYASGSAARAESSEAQADRQKAKTVVMYEIPASLKDRPEQILKRKGYTVSYNSETKNPNWVAWHLTKSHTYGDHQRKNEVFTEDTDVKAPRATDRDYYNSRYDRGHMCPAGDNKWDKQHPGRMIQTAPPQGRPKAVFFDAGSGGRQGGHIASYGEKLAQ